MLAGMVLVLGLVAGGGQARAEDTGACAKFKWSIDREAKLFSAGPSRLASGGTFSLENGAAAVDLQPADTVAFAVPPERKPAAGSFGAVLQMASAPEAKLYEITLSGEAWIDVIQDGKPVKSGAFSGQEGCPGVRKSVRFPLAAKPTVVQVSNAKAATINLAILPAQ